MFDRITELWVSHNNREKLSNHPTRDKILRRSTGSVSKIRKDMVTALFSCWVKNKILNVSGCPSSGNDLIIALCKDVFDILNKVFEEFFMFLCLKLPFPGTGKKNKNKNKTLKCFRLPVPGARNGTRTYPGLCVGCFVHLRHAQCWTSYCKGEKGGDNVDVEGDDVDDDVGDDDVDDAVGDDDVDYVGDDDVGDDDADDVGDGDVDEDVNGLTSSSTFDLHSVATVRKVDEIC